MHDPWEEDRLGYKAIGESFTSLIKSVDSAKVISIEAGFGRGKTFFRKAWSQHLQQNGEIVVEVDVQQSDHSGDPIVTLLGALVEAIPREEDDTGKKVIDSAKKLGALGARTVAKFVLKSGADEVIDAVTNTAIDNLEDFDALDNVINELGEGMSKAAGQFIAAQMAIEKVRKEELPQQLDALHAALVESRNSERVIIVIDELDRCHPDYAIAFLEAMKLVFNREGFVFCLMVNADYLENLAQHRFGHSNGDEKYLDKFVDFRLRLEPHKHNLKNAVFEIASELPLAIPFGEGDAFSVKHAAKLASDLADSSKLSMRKIKRIIQKIEITLRCYAAQPLDASLLVLLAFQDEVPGDMPQNFLPRSFLTPDLGEKWMALGPDDVYGGRNNVVHKMNEAINDLCPEFVGLPRDRYRLPNDQHHKDWTLIFQFLAPHYIPSHRAVLDAMSTVIVPSD